MSLPTTLELATLAASINTETTPQGKISMAMKLWKLAQEHIDQQSEITQKREAQSHEKTALFQGKVFYGGMPLEEFLKQVFPRSKKDDAMKWYRDYLRFSITFEDDQQAAPRKSESTIEDSIQRIMGENRLTGIAYPEASARQLLAHRAMMKNETFSNRGRSGARKRHKKQKSEQGEKKSLEKNKTRKNATSKKNATASKSTKAVSKK